MATTQASDWKPTETELQFVAAIELGQAFWPEQLAETSQAVAISAELLRRILLGLPVPRPQGKGRSRSEQDTPVKVTPLGLRIIPPADPQTAWLAHPRVKVTGRLAVEGATAPGGGPLPSLRLEFCDFEAPIDLCGTHLTDVSLRGSRFAAVRLSDAVIDGNLNLSQCGPRTNTLTASDGVDRDQSEYWPFAGHLFRLAPDKEGYVPANDSACLLPAEAPLAPCIVQLSQITIAGDCDLVASNFVRDALQDCPFGSGRRIASAVSLQGAKIDGSVRIVGTVVVGGISLRSCNVRDDLWLVAARLLAYPSSGALGEAFNAQMAIVGGGLMMRALAADTVALFPALRERQDFGPSTILGLIYLPSVSAGTLWLSGAVILGYVWLSGAKIANGVHLGGFAGASDESAALAFDGTLDLSNAAMDSLDLNGFGSPTRTPAVTTLIKASDPALARFGLKGMQAWEPSAILRMENASVRLALRLHRGTLRALPGSDLKDTTALDLYKADIGRGIDIAPKVEAIGAVRLTRAVVSGGAKLSAQSIAAVQTKPMRVGQPSAGATAIDLNGATISGDLEIACGRISGIIKVSGASISGNTTLGPNPGELMTQPPMELVVARMTISRPDGLPAARPDGLPAASLAQHNAPCQIDFSGSRIAGSLHVTSLRWSMVDTAAPDGAIEQWLLPFLSDDGTYTARTLACFPHAVLVERAHEGRLLQVLIHRNEGFFIHPMNGTSHTFHELRMRKDQPLYLRSDKARRDYLAFFCDSLVTGGSFTWNGEQRSQASSFSLVRSVESGLILPQTEIEDTDGPLSGILKKHRPGALTQRGKDSKGWLYDATVRYQGFLFNARFRIGHDGSVDMVDDTPLGQLDHEPVDVRGIGQPIERDAPGVELMPYGHCLPPARAFAALVELRRTLQSRPVAQVRLEQLQCASLYDHFGNAWGIDDNPVQLHLAGLSCGSVEPAAFANRATLIHARQSATSRLLGAVEEDAATSRKRWLRRQFVALRGVIGETDAMPRLSSLRAKLLPDLWRKSTGVSDQDFIPQSWEAMANAHIRAGDVAAGRDLIVERRDAEAILRFRRLARALWNRRGLGWRAAMAGLLIAAAGLAWKLWRDGGGLIDLLYADNATLALALAIAIVTATLSLPLLSILSDAFFRIGFRYGLSAQRALVTFAAMLAIGSLGTHLARTGTPLSLSTDWEALSQPDLRGDIALVLLAGYSANDTASPDARTASSPLSSAGKVVYARAAPCNLGVSSILYAADVFVPVLDLDQESRCTIREEPEQRGTYTAWRIAKVVYEVLGWIVTSLVVLTITGLMRRDIER